MTEEKGVKHLLYGGEVMNAKKIIAFILFGIVSIIIGFLGGLFWNASTIDRLEANILELSERNNTLSARIDGLVAGTESSAATSIALAEGLGEFVSGLSEQLERAQAITNRAQRIAELARVLDKGITELIEKIQLVEEGLVGSRDSSSD